MNEKVDIFDFVIKESINSEVESIPVPEMEDLWNNISKELRRKKKITFYSRPYVKVGIACVILFIGVFIMGTVSSYSHYRGVLNFLTKNLGDSITIFVNSNKNSDGNPEIEAFEQVTELEIVEHSLTLEEAMDKAGFIFGLPQVIPVDYSLSEVLLTELSGKTINMELIYQSSVDIIKVKIEPILGEYASTMNINSAFGSVERVFNNGLEYHVISFTNGLAIIIWEYLDVKYTAESNNKEELEKLVFSIK